ncbi:hypothetical protein [Azospirillum argentinense]|uniref:Nmad5 family putative nucleotide modification protein n=1 Tax=Azospirillum argentinense TaxID=2970906 RepID=UPI0032E041C2
MSKRRLTQQMRDQITNALLLHRFEAERTRLRTVAFEAMKLARFEALVLLCGSRALAKDWIERMDKAPMGVFAKRSSSFNVTCGGRYVKIDMGGHELRVPNNIGKDGGIPFFDRDNHPEAYAAIEAYLDDVTRLDKAEKEARAQAEGALKSFGTVDRLLDGWPEVKPFVPAWAFDDKPALPALPLPKLNAAFGLPIEETV